MFDNQPRNLISPSRNRVLEFLQHSEKHGKPKQQQLGWLLHMQTPTSLFVVIQNGVGIFFQCLAFFVSAADDDKRRDYLRKHKEHVSYSL